MFIIISNPWRSHFAGALFSFAKAADVEPLRPVNIVDRGVKRTAAEDLALDQRGALHKHVCTKRKSALPESADLGRCLEGSQRQSHRNQRFPRTVAPSETILIITIFSWCTVRVAKRIGCQHTELVKDEKAETLIMEGETRPGKRTASLDVF